MVCIVIRKSVKLINIFLVRRVDCLIDSRTVKPDCKFLFIVLNKLKTVLVRIMLSFLNGIFNPFICRGCVQAMINHCFNRFFTGRKKKQDANNNSGRKAFHDKAYKLSDITVNSESLLFIAVHNSCFTEENLSEFIFSNHLLLKQEKMSCA